MRDDPDCEFKIQIHFFTSSHSGAYLIFRLCRLQRTKSKGNPGQPTAKVAKGGGAAERSGTKGNKPAVVERNQPQDRTKERMSRIETVDWTRWLADNKLEDFESAFRSEMGVTHISDLTFVTADDLAGIGMGTLKQRRFLQAVKESL